MLSQTVKEQLNIVYNAFYYRNNPSDPCRMTFTRLLSDFYSILESSALYATKIEFYSILNKFFNETDLARISVWSGKVRKSLKLKILKKFLATGLGMIYSHNEYILIHCGTSSQNSPIDQWEDCRTNNGGGLKTMILDIFKGKIAKISPAGHFSLFSNFPKNFPTGMNQWLCIQPQIWLLDAGLFSHCNKNFQGQKQNTCVADTAHQLDRQCCLARAKYNAACAALLSLKGPGQWESELQELHNSDMVSLHGSLLEIDEDKDEEDAKGMERKKQPRLGPPKEAGEGHQEISWISMQEGALGDGSNKDLNHAIKLEWLQSHACAH
ncbi:hypothetical protein EDD18DRAFT_1101824 [Armillaria luteobubalina]|uniref:Uncharacterized protein n=1 Tax=Armillaria luteobubalina TaxID=153913 RepID=A0AA39UWQ2_9AGAR|nr:hypothetical protein EDD18DRAFT_1101824 [Armillaria luteobubalina]